MGAVDMYALGRSVKATLSDAATFGTAVKAVAGDSAKIISYMMKATQERVVRNDTRSTRSVQEHVARMIGAEGNFKSFLNGRGGATPPDIGLALAALMGQETIGGSDVTYSLTDTQSLPFFDFRAESEGVVMEALISAFVKSGKFVLSGTTEPTVEFQLGAKKHVLTGTGTANGGSTGTTVTMQDGEAYAIEDDSIVSVGSNDNLLTSGLVAASHQFDVDSSITWSDTNAIAPYTPWADASCGGSPAALIQGSLALNNETSLKITAIEIEVDNGTKEENEYYGSTHTDDFEAGDRIIKAKITFKARKSDIIRLARTKYVDVSGVNPGDAGSGLVLTAGPSTALWTFTAPEPFFHMPGVLDMPEREEGKITLECTFRPSTNTAADELTIVTSGS